MFQAQRAERANRCPPPPPSSPPPSLCMQKAICYNSDRLASPGLRDGCGVLESISPQRKMPPKSRGAGREQGQEVQGQEAQGPGDCFKGGAPRGDPPPGMGPPPAMGVMASLLWGKPQAGGERERWRCLSDSDTQRGACMHSCARTLTCTRVHTR